MEHEVGAAVADRAAAQRQVPWVADPHDVCLGVLQVSPQPPCLGKWEMPVLPGYVPNVHRCGGSRLRERRALHAIDLHFVSTLRHPLGVPDEVAFQPTPTR